MHISICMEYSKHADRSVEIYTILYTTVRINKARIKQEAMELLGNIEDNKPYLICEESIGMIVDSKQPEGVGIVCQKNEV